MILHTPIVTSFGALEPGRIGLMSSPDEGEIIFIRTFQASGDKTDVVLAAPAISDAGYLPCVINLSSGNGAPVFDLTDRIEVHAGIEVLRQARSYGESPPALRKGCLLIIGSKTYLGYYDRRPGMSNNLRFLDLASGEQKPQEVDVNSGMLVAHWAMLYRDPLLSPPALPAPLVLMGSPIEWAKP